MFKTPKDYEYDEHKKEEQVLEYRIAANDKLNVRAFSNDGFKLIDIVNESSVNATSKKQLYENGIIYLVEYDGYVKFPIIGRIKLEGLTLREAEFLLEEKFNDIYVDPFVMLDIANKRVTIFPGEGGPGVVLTLSNQNTTLLEALALAGGIRERGRADRIKLIRGDLSNPEVYFIDLSTIEGLNQANIVLQANDVIYVEPIGITTRQVLSEVSPVLSFITSLITLYIVIDRL